MRQRLLPAALLVPSLFSAAMVIFACNDQGSVAPPSPVVTSVSPDSAAPGDTLTILGSNFGGVRGTGSVAFASSPLPESAYVSWSASKIRVRVPSYAGGSVTVTVRIGNAASNGVAFTIVGSHLISFNSQVLPIFTANCAVSGCHTGPTPAHGFNASTYTTLRQGGTTFGTSVIIDSDSTNSGVMKMIRGTNNPLGVRMPLAGTYAATGLPDSLIVRIGTWIKQGAKDN